ncbi:MAG TPA: tetratricopeptide repeat protein [Candidatus Acidoferrum sp.]|nr:tetratricopeptide repeat protein [Candidatus Acidoferrum sp.]
MPKLREARRGQALDRDLRGRRTRNGWVKSKTEVMPRTKLKILLGLLAVFSLAISSLAQEPLPRPAPQRAPDTNVTVDGSEAMFTTMCALLAAGFESDVNSSNWSPYRAEMRERLEHQQGPAVDALRKFYKEHELDDPEATLSRFIWFGLVSGPAPSFDPVLRRDELPPDVIALEGFQEILSNYYKEQNIGALWRQVQPVYNREISQLHDEVAQTIFVTNGYLRVMLEPESQRTFTIIVEPLVGRLTNVRNFGDHYALVLSGANQLPVDIVRHAFLHFLLDPLPLQYPHVVAVKRPLYDLAARAPRLSSDLRDDFSSYFAECLVRAVELRLKRLSPSEKEVVLETDDSAGYVLVRPLFNSLTKFEESAPSIRLFFPDLVRSIDEGAEEKRVAQIQFAPAPAANPGATASESVARRKFQAPPTLPNDEDAIAALTEGERRIAEKNPQAAELSFKKVLAKYPDQPRAWYGLGLVALLEHDGSKAKEVFGRLTTGDHAATQDPLVLTWSHVYLARIYGDEGNMDKAKAEFQAALEVTGGPERAREAAQKGLSVVDRLKSGERP